MNDAGEDGTYRETAGRYEAIFSSMAEGVVFHRADGAIDACNASAERILGLTRDQMSGRTSMDPCWSSIHEDGSAFTGETHPAMVSLRTGESLSNVVMGVRKPDGNLIWISVNSRPLRRDGQRPYAVVTTFTDITERKRTDEDLRRAYDGLARAEHHYRTLFNSGSDAIFVLQPESDGRSSSIVQVNDNACALLGYSREELLQIQAASVIPAERQHLAPQHTRTRDNMIREKVLIARHGRRIPVEVHTHQFFSDGKTFSISCVRDISGRKRADAERAALEQRLAEAERLEGLGRLAGGVAHEFNNILTVINGYSDLLISRLEPSDRLRSCAAAIHDSGKKAAALTAQLLAFGRRQLLQLSPLDLNRTIREFTGTLLPLIGENIRVVAHLDSSLKPVMGDASQLELVILNLACNARDAMPDGGQIDIGTANVELDELRATALDPNAAPGWYVALTVTDNGPGVDEATCRRIFEPFFTTKRAGNGAGLGLASVYGIARQLGGWVDVSSEAGAGTTFRVYLPVVDGSFPSEAPGTGVEDTKESVAKRRETILLVEDQEVVRALFRDSLEQSGYTVIDAPDGEEAVAAAIRSSGPIDALVTDVVLPGMNGKSLAERLAAQRPNLRVIFMSGFTAGVFVERGLLDRSAVFLQKPFGARELQAALRSVLGGADKTLV